MSRKSFYFSANPDAESLQRKFVHFQTLNRASGEVIGRSEPLVRIKTLTGLEFSLVPDVSACWLQVVNGVFGRLNGYVHNPENAGFINGARVFTGRLYTTDEIIEVNDGQNEPYQTSLAFMADKYEIDRGRSSPYGDPLGSKRVICSSYRAFSLEYRLQY